MAHDDTRGRRGGESRGGRHDRPVGGFQKRDGGARGGQFGHDSGPRDRKPWHAEGAAPGRDQGEAQARRPFRAPFAREEGRPPFQSRERNFERQDRGPEDARQEREFRGEPNGERPSFRSGPGGDRPPFRDGQGGDRPPFRGGQGGDRPPFRGGPREDRPSYRDDRPSFRDDRGDGARPSFRDRSDAPARDERPTYRQGRGGYRSFDQDLGRSERPQSQDRWGGDRPAFGSRERSDAPFQSRRPDGDRPAFQGKPFQSRRPDGDRPAFQSRRPGGDRPEFQERRPYSGGRPFERREPGSGSFESVGRPLGTSTRAGRSPVSQFERIQADVYGRWPVLESLRAGNVLKVYIAAGVKDSADHLQEIQTVAAEKHVTIVRVDRFDLDRVLGNVNHQGIAAACRPHHYTPFDDVVQAAKRSGEQPLVLLFDGVQDPQNLGSILRTAEAVGVDGAVLPKHNQAGVTPAVVRASAGATEHLPIAEVANLRQSIAALKEAGYWIVGLDMAGGTDYDNFDVDSPLALVVGSEGHGISRMVSEECDYLVRLPMRGQVGSLNASVAAGIVLYEIGRRRGTAGKPRNAAKPASIAAEANGDAGLAAAVLEEEIEDDELDLELEYDPADGVIEDEDEELPDDRVEGDEIQAESLDIEDLVGGIDDTAGGGHGTEPEPKEQRGAEATEHQDPQ
jgi:23S rRNA (guanosine2251-2'-O)-methyltransferase